MRRVSGRGVHCAGRNIVSIPAGFLRNPRGPGGPRHSHPRAALVSARYSHCSAATQRMRIKLKPFVKTLKSTDRFG